MDPAELGHVTAHERVCERACSSRGSPSSRYPRGDNHRQASSSARSKSPLTDKMPHAMAIPKLESRNEQAQHVVDDEQDLVGRIDIQGAAERSDALRQDVGRVEATEAQLQEIVGEGSVRAPEVENRLLPLDREIADHPLEMPAADPRLDGGRRMGNPRPADELALGPNTLASGVEHLCPTDDAGLTAVSLRQVARSRSCQDPRLPPLGHVKTLLAAAMTTSCSCSERLG